MPADKYGFKPTPAQMSFGDIVAHLIEGNDYLCGLIGGAKAPTRAKVTGASSKDALIGELKETFAFCNDALAKLDDSKLERAAAVLRRKDALSRQHHVRDGGRLVGSLQPERDLPSSQRAAAAHGEEGELASHREHEHKRKRPLAMFAAAVSLVHLHRRTSD